MGLGAALSAPGWVKSSWKLGRGIGLGVGWGQAGGGLGTSGGFSPPWLIVLPFGLLPGAGLRVPGRGHPWDLVRV